jgi:hypothetical protein
MKGQQPFAVAQQQTRCNFISLVLQALKQSQTYYAAKPAQLACCSPSCVRGELLLCPPAKRRRLSNAYAWLDSNQADGHPAAYNSMQAAHLLNGNHEHALVC